MFVAITLLHVWKLSEPYLLRTFSTQRYLYTTKVRGWYGASIVQVWFYGTWLFR